MNIHYLELFCYVAKHGGISCAVRKIPYGIQQPAVSGQILQLEEYLGVTLFQRRPFLLTPEGEELYKFISPFFDNLEMMAEKLRGGKSQLMRIAASTIVLRDHFPELLQDFQLKNPHLKLILREGLQPQMEEWLQRQEVDLAVTLLEGRPGQGIRSVALIDLPLILLTEKRSRLRSAEDIWKQDRIMETLISLPGDEAIPRSFHQALAKMGQTWPTGLEVSSLDLVEAYAAKGFGVGLTVDVPLAKRSSRLRVLPLPDFPPVVVGVLWRGRRPPLAEEFVASMEDRARMLVRSRASRLPLDELRSSKSP